MKYKFISLYFFLPGYLKAQYLSSRHNPLNTHQSRFVNYAKCKGCFAHVEGQPVRYDNIGTITIRIRFWGIFC